MKLAGERKAIEAALDAYRAWLDRLPDDLFDVTPPSGGWSFAEVYSHVLQSTLGASIAAEKCARGTAPTTRKGLNLLGRFMMLTNRFPPAKIKAPPVIPVLKITKEEARNMIIKCRKRIESIAPLLPEAQDHHRISHPRLGMLHAKHWFKFLRVHLQHHLKQLERIEKELGRK